MLPNDVAFVPGISTTARRGRVFAIAEQASMHVRRTEDGLEVPVAEVDDSALYLGELDGEPCFALFGAPSIESERVPLRQLFGALSDEQFGVAGRALGLTAWDRDFQFCGRCGQATQRSAIERMRTCTGCGFGSYPRLSPAVIMLVERDGKALLARNARTKMPFYSTLAGFVEVGETLEHTVVREVKEEAGVDIQDVRYFGSQPWPFTGSLMIGFTARWAAGEIAADPTEILDANWFAPNELPIVPPKLSIARELIDDFVKRNS